MLCFFLFCFGSEFLLEFFVLLVDVENLNPKKSLLSLFVLNVVHELFDLVLDSNISAFILLDILVQLFLEAFNLSHLVLDCILKLINVHHV